MKPVNLERLLFSLLISLIVGCSSPEQNNNDLPEDDHSHSYRDIYPDTWVASDALGWSMPSSLEVGPEKKDRRRVTGIFYITWHTQDKAKLSKPYAADVTKADGYWDEWEIIFQTMPQMQAEGNKVPRFCFRAFNRPVITVVQDLYEKIYKEINIQSYQVSKTVKTYITE